MKRKFIVLIFLFSCSAVSYGQIKLNVEAAVSNLFRYGSGYQYTGPVKNPKEYFENLTDARLKVNGVTFGMRFEISDSIEYGLNFRGIAKRFIEYDHESGISLRAGDFFEAISRGLALNVFEDRTLYYDTGIDGVRITYNKTFPMKNPLKIKAQILGGNIDYRDYLTPERIETYKIRDAYLRISPLKPITIGLNYVHSNGILPEAEVLTYVNTDIPEAVLNINYPDFQLYTEYAHKTSLVSPNIIYPDPITAKGDGLYSSVSYSFKNTGITFEYKNYRFDITLPGNRNNTRPTRMLPYQNPPTAQRENTSVLTSRNTHVVDFNDEVGGQLDVVYSPNDKLSFNINGSIASRHYQYEDIDTSNIISYQRIDRSDSYLPSLNDAFSPFWEIYLEGEDYATEKIYAKLALALQNNVIYNQNNPSSTEKIFTTTIPLEFRYSFTNKYSLTFINETQWASNTIRIGDDNFMNQYFSLTLSRSPDLNFTFASEFTNDDEEPTGRKSWFLGEILYKLNESNTFSVSYGSERGGLRCANGICRFVQPFDGFRATIATQY